jgi:Ca2+-transporting ATPase
MNRSTTIEPVSIDSAVGYTRTERELLAILDVDPMYGLSEVDVVRRRAAIGSNVLARPPEKSRIRLFLEQFRNPLVYILVGAAIVTSIVSEVSDTVTIVVVLLFNAVLGYLQEHRAGERMKAVMSLSAPIARVVRDGQQMTIPAAELVPGDIVLLESGMHVPADGRIVESRGLLVDESILTGESIPAGKRADETLIAGTPVGDRINMVFSGTTVRRGRARIVVTATGSRSEIGEIVEQTASAGIEGSPLQDRLAAFGRVMTIGIASVIALILGIGLLRGHDVTTMILTAIGLAVSAIPEGLPIAVTVALSIGIYQMARRQTVIRRMSAVETLGATTVICSDKTGTLTCNQMTTVALAAGDGLYRVTGTGYDPAGSIEPLSLHGDRSDDQRIGWMLRIGLLCNESSFREIDGRRHLVGDPTEGAMIVAAEKAGIAERELGRWRRTVLLPFESERMYMSAQISDEDDRYLIIKGSVERLLSMCEWECRSDSMVPLDSESIIRCQEEMSARGLRVIATAYRSLGAGEPIDSPDPTGCIFAGIFGIEDPARPEAAAAVADAQRAGIRVMMITGDHASTANAIARQLGIGGDRTTTITGAAIERMSDEELDRRIETASVFARVAPEHKLRIVRALQRRGEVVAMTGDGVNDAPALRQSDIGIALGSGTDVAKEASAMVVQDDNFATIVDAIRYGRVMFGNLRHMILYVLSTSGGGVLTLASAVILGFPLPIIALQLLWINLITDGTSTIPLAYEQEHRNTMSRPPRRRTEGLLSIEMGERIVATAVIMMLGTLLAFDMVLGQYRYTVTDREIPEPVLVHARTVAFTTLAFFQIWNAHNSRSLAFSLFSIGPIANVPLVAVTTLAVLLQVLGVEARFMQPFLDTTGLTLGEWGLCLGISFSIILFVEFRKVVGRLLERTARQPCSCSSPFD